MLCATLTANADITLPASAKGAKSGGAAPLLQEAAPVNVRVPRGGAVEIPPKLDVRDDVDFGTVTIGSSMIEEITIENRGGGVLKGRASVDEPWKIVGKATYNLRVGETQKIRLRFAPQLDEAFQGEVRYSSAPDQKTSLRAVGEAAIAISPRRLELKPAQDGTRSGVLTIGNRTTGEVTVRLRLGGRLKGPERATLLPGGEVSVVIEASADDPGSIDDVVRVESPNFTTSVPLHAFAVGPVLRVSPESLSLGRIDTEKQPGGTLRIRNTGGTGTFVRAEPSEHVVIAVADTSFWLEAGATRDIAVSIDPWNAGTYRERLTIKSDGSEFEIPVQAEVTRGRASAPTLVSRPFRKNAPGEIAAFGPILASVGAPRLGPLRIKRITATTCEIDWQVPPNDPLGYKVESLAASPDTQGRPTWRPIPNVVIHDPRNPGKALGEEWVSHGVKVDDWASARANTTGKGAAPPILSALIEELSPDTVYSIRVSAVTAKNAAPEISPPLQIHTPEGLPLPSDPVGLLVSTSVVLLALTVRYKMRKRPVSRVKTDSPAPAFQGPPVRARRKKVPFIRELGPGRFEIDCDDAQY